MTRVWKLVERVRLRRFREIVDKNSNVNLEIGV